MPEDEVPPTVRRIPRSACTCGCVATTTRPPSSARGATGCGRSSIPGDDVFVFFRHDEVGRGAELALEFGDLGGDTSLGVDRLFARERLRRAEHDEHLEALGDVVEPVRYVAATKTSEPGPTARCSSPTVIVARPATTR